MALWLAPNLSETAGRPFGGFNGPRPACGRREARISSLPVPGGLMVWRYRLRQANQHAAAWGRGVRV